MISFKTISYFRECLTALMKIKRGVYASAEEEIRNAFKDRPIETIRINNDKILLDGDMIVIKLRLPDRKQKLAKKDGYRLIYMVS